MADLDALTAELDEAKKKAKKSDPASLERRNAASQALNDARAAEREKAVAAGERTSGVGVATQNGGK